MKLLKALLLSLFAASSSYALTMVAQNDPNVTFGYLIVSSMTCSGSPCPSGGGGGGAGAIIGTGAIGNVPSVSVASSNTMTMTGSLNVFGSSVVIPASLGLNVTYGVTASTFTGNGAALTNLTGANVGSGVPAANIAAGNLGASVVTQNIAAGAYSNITGVGTLASGVWNGTALTSTYLPAQTEYTNTQQTITSSRTFQSTILISSTVAAGSSGATGTSGQVLTSNGPNSAPTWQAGGSGGSVVSGRPFCPPEFGCGLTSAGTITLSSASVSCQGFWGGVPGASGIIVSTVSVFSMATYANAAVGFYDSTCSKIAQSTTTLSSETSFTMNFPGGVTLNSGSYYYICWAGDAASQQLFTSPYETGYVGSMMNLGQPTASLATFTMTNTSTVNSGGQVILPATCGTKVNPGAGGTKTLTGFTMD